MRECDGNTNSSYECCGKLLHHNIKLHNLYLLVYGRGNMKHILYSSICVFIYLSKGQDEVGGGINLENGNTMNIS